MFLKRYFDILENTLIQFSCHQLDEKIDTPLMCVPNVELHPTTC